jgi:hypothetical protein
MRCVTVWPYGVGAGIDKSAQATPEPLEVIVADRGVMNVTRRDESRERLEARPGVPIFLDDLAEESFVVCFNGHSRVVIMGASSYAQSKPICAR